MMLCWTFHVFERAGWCPLWHHKEQILRTACYGPCSRRRQFTVRHKILLKSLSRDVGSLNIEWKNLQNLLKKQQHRNKKHIFVGLSFGRKKQNKTKPLGQIIMSLHVAYSQKSVGVSSNLSSAERSRKGVLLSVWELKKNKPNLTLVFKRQSFSVGAAEIHKFSKKQTKKTDVEIWKSPVPTPLCSLSLDLNKTSARAKFSITDLKKNDNKFLAPFL